jgi:hypothetical protein
MKGSAESNQEMYTATMLWGLRSITTCLEKMKMSAYHFVNLFGVMVGT